MFQSKYSGQEVEDSINLSTTTETGRIGLRLNTEDQENHGDIGSRATDFSHSNSVSSTKGATGNDSVSFNLNTTAFGKNSSAFGEYTTSKAENSFCIGKCNLAKTDTKFEVGIGTDSFNLANAFEVYTDGRLRAPGLSTDLINSPISLATKEYVDSTISEFVSVIEDTGTSVYTPNFGNNYFEYTLTENSILTTPVNWSKGRQGTIIVIQDDIGGHSFTIESAYITPAGSPILDESAGNTSVFKYTVVSNTKVLLEFIASF